MSSNPFLSNYDHLKSIHQPFWYQQLLQPLSVLPVFILASLWAILHIAASHFFQILSGWSMVQLLSWQYTRSTVWPNLLQFYCLLLSWVSALRPHIVLLYFLNVPFPHPPLLLTVCSCYFQCLKSFPVPFPQCPHLRLGLNKNISSRKFWPRIRTGGLKSWIERFTNMFCFLEGVIKNINLTFQNEAFALQSAMILIFHAGLLQLST